MTQKTNHSPWTLDIRVRERNLRSGALTEKDVEKFLAGLPDAGAESEAFGIPQPALTESHQHTAAAAAHHHAPVSVIESDADIDDEDEDDEDDAGEDDSASDVTPDAG